MSKNLVILGSSRKNSNTLLGIQKTFPDEDYELVNLLEYNLKYYDYDHGNLGDGFQKIVDKMLESEIITFATPVYWYSMSGHLKVFLDRLTELLSAHKPKGKALAGKVVNLVAIGGSKELPEGFEIPFRLTAKYFDMEFDKTFYHSIQ